MATSNDPARTLDAATARMLLDRARQARARAYAPYSRFPVGAALLAEDGEVVTGCNVENASYGLSNCAERTAIFTAVAGGRTRFSAVAVVGPQDDAPCAPCGACRQVMYEFGPDMVVVLPDSAENGGYGVTTMRDLLPGAFVPARLEHP
ncbi:MAG: cytidine deaminase [Gemmatimonadetes bacterium]|jgi:cytidine deaminase|nr:cytidine deaminase [Gemmatimonadota bacterium]